MVPPLYLVVFFSMQQFIKEYKRVFTSSTDAEAYNVWATERQAERAAAAAERQATEKQAERVLAIVKSSLSPYSKRQSIAALTNSDRTGVFIICICFRILPTFLIPSCFLLCLVTTFFVSCVFLLLVVSIDRVYCLSCSYFFLLFLFFCNSTARKTVSLFGLPELGRGGVGAGSPSSASENKAHKEAAFEQHDFYPLTDLGLSPTDGACIWELHRNRHLLFH